MTSPFAIIASLIAITGQSLAPVIAMVSSMGKRKLIGVASVVYFALIYTWISDKITQFGGEVMGRTMAWVSGVALILITLWILIQGWRMITGQSREPMMAMVFNMRMQTSSLNLSQAFTRNSITLSPRRTP